jgi:hypothetical protein
MLTSPTTVTVDGTAHSLSKVNQDNYSSTFIKKATGLEYKLSVRHQDEKAKLGAVVMERHNVDLTYTTFDVDGKPTVYQVYAVLRTPKGADPTIVEKLSVGFNTWLTANDGLIIGWES